MATVDVNVWLQALDGTWEKCGADRMVGVDPESETHSHNEWGPDKASFDLKRPVFAIWPDLGAFTPVEIEIGGVVVWDGRVGETPLKAGVEQTINVQCEGWQYHLDDDVYTRAYVHSKLTDWKDTRSLLTADLTRFVSGPTVGSTQGVITLGWANGAPVVNNNVVGVTLDLGYAAAAARLVLSLQKGTVTDAAIQLYAWAHPEPNMLGTHSSVGALEAIQVTTGEGVHAGTFATPYRYVTLFLIYTGAGGTFAADQIARLTAVSVFGAAAYESNSVSRLHASTVVQDAVERGTLLLSADFSKIAATSFAIPDCAFSNAKTPREVAEAVNAYHNWIIKLLPGRRVSYQPRPTDATLEMGAWSGADLDDTSANSGAEIYNRALIEAAGPDGSPLAVQRTAGQQGGLASPVASPTPDNPSFTTNTESWTGTVTRDTVVFNSAPASGRMALTAKANAVIIETFTGTFKRGVTYRLSYVARVEAAGHIAAVFGAIGAGRGDLEAVTSAALTPGAWTPLTITWTPQADATGVTFQYRAFNDTNAENKAWIDDLVLGAVEPTLVDRRSFARTKVIQVSSAITEAEGKQIGDVFLQAHGTTPFKGSAAVVPGSVRTVQGGQPVHPSQLGLHTQELLRLGHWIDPDTGGMGRDATIAAVSYSHRDQRAQVELDDRRSNFDALLARLAVVQAPGS